MRASDGGCDCFSGAIGQGPTCIEFTNAITCNGQGEALEDGSCRCYDPALGTGPTCVEYSNSATCDDNGIATPDGGCFWLCDLIFRGQNGCDLDWYNGDNDVETLLENNKYCGKCTGNCDDDSDCGPGLMCMIRDEDDDYTTINVDDDAGGYHEMKLDVSYEIPGCLTKGACVHVSSFLNDCTQFVQAFKHPTKKKCRLQRYSAS